ncbi:MAG: YggT family protein [Spirochaetales bacterium]|nr:YggT family protein [Spirochaetales bacterium]
MVVLRVLNTIALCYLLLISLRIILSWMHRPAAGRARELLVRVTEPYLAFFRRVRFLRPRSAAGILDLSPVAAILVLVMAIDLLGALVRFGQLRVGNFLSALVGALWSGVSFLALLLLVILIVLMLTLRRSAAKPLIQTLSALAQPVVEALGLRIAALFSPRRRLGAMQVLLITAAALILLLIGGRALVALLQPVLQSLPF